MSMYDDVNKLYCKSSLYDAEFLNYEDDFVFWKYWINKIKPKSVIEIGIGNGRLVNLLSPLVDKYDGIEISTNIIKDFKIKNPKYKGMIYNQDMKNIEIDYKYDLIILPFNTFSYLYTLNDVSNFFKGIKRISGNSTIIMIDIFNPKIDDLKDTLKYKLCRKFVINNKICKLYEKHLYDSYNQIITYKKKYVIENNELVLNLPNRVFFPQEVLNLFQLNGFKVKEIIGDYNNEKFNSNSRKQIFFLEKRLDDENFKIFKVD